MATELTAPPDAIPVGTAVSVTPYRLTLLTGWPATVQAPCPFQTHAGRYAAATTATEQDICPTGAVPVTVMLKLGLPAIQKQLTKYEPDPLIATGPLYSDPGITKSAAIPDSDNENGLPHVSGHTGVLAEP
jgi:hypothetical protein